MMWSRISTLIKRRKIARTVMLKSCFILTTALLCNGQLSQFFFPFSKVTRGIVEGIAGSSLVNLASPTGDLVADGLRALLFLPEAATRAFGVGSQAWLPESRTNVIGELDDFISDYNSGIGNEDATLDFVSIVRKYGYFVETYDVTTEDGYVLSLYRIPSNGSSVFLMHGLLGCADDFIVAGPESGLAYLLAREGYDVWIGNARGSKHSRKHIHFDPSDAEFWDFSWHEIGVYDLPAMIDFTLELTGAGTLKYIGHSQGTTAFFVMTSERPEYNSKVSLMVALSPVAFMSNVRSPVVRLLSAGLPFFHGIVKSAGFYEFLPDNNLMRALKPLICSGGILSDIVCSNVLFLVAGVGYAQFNFTNLPVLMGHTPAGASAKQLAHYGQGVLTGEFRQFDYGSPENLEIYGAVTPPRYMLEKITTPVSLFYSDEDWLAHPTDVDKLYNELNNAIDIHKIPFEQFNHLDFLWAKDFKVLVYKRLRKLLAFF